MPLHLHVRFPSSPSIPHPPLPSPPLYPLQVRYVKCHKPNRGSSEPHSFPPSSHTPYSVEPLSQVVVSQQFVSALTHGARASQQAVLHNSRASSRTRRIEKQKQKQGGRQEVGESKCPGPICCPLPTLLPYPFPLPFYGRICMYHVQASGYCTSDVCVACQSLLTRGSCSSQLAAPSTQQAPHRPRPGAPPAY